MLRENQELRSIALQTLSNQWGTPVISTLVYFILAGALSTIPMIGQIYCLLVALPLMYGFFVLFLRRFRGEKMEINNLFDGFHDYGRILGTTLLVSVYTLLWSLLLIIPGIIKSYSYAMTFYILNDEPELSFNAAIEKSMSMMDGKKMKLFLLDLSFIGWFLLSLLSLGIGFLWLMPYIYTARAAFYEDLKKEVFAVN